MRSLQSYFGNHDELFSFYDIVIGFFVSDIIYVYVYVLKGNKFWNSAWLTCLNEGPSGVSDVMWQRHDAGRQSLLSFVKFN